MNTEDIKEAISHLKKANYLLNKGPLEYYLESLLKCREAFFERCAPFKVGDLVRLNKTPIIEEDSGWRSCRHFLIDGAEGVIHEVDFINGQFIGSVMFNNESYISGEGIEFPIMRKHLFNFSETYLDKVS